MTTFQRSRLLGRTALAFKTIRRSPVSWGRSRTGDLKKDLRASITGWKGPEGTVRANAPAAGAPVIG